MKLITTGVTVGVMLLSACSNQSVPLPLQVATEVPAIVEDKTPSPPTGAALLAQQPAEVHLACSRPP
ncbi:MAG TPA: hypothetical protein VMT61_07385 [Candidatus Binataceae bacterium]|nr:hypothetical protein [Candidatus Binataceae bacterium]